MTKRIDNQFINSLFYCKKQPFTTTIPPRPPSKFTISKPDKLVSIWGRINSKYNEMDIQEIIKSGANFTVSIGINDLKQWHKAVIADTRRELEEVVISEKAESYPTVKQVSDMLNVNASTLWRWNRKGYLKTIEFGGGRRYKMSEVKALMNGGRSK